MRDHQNKEWLAEQIAAGKTTKQIANENNISYKLVEIYLKKYEIPFTPKISHA
jgi:DNA-binding NarL/FixJ family response regulator